MVLVSSSEGCLSLLPQPCLHTGPSETWLCIFSTCCSSTPHIGAVGFGSRLCSNCFCKCERWTTEEYDRRCCESRPTNQCTLCIVHIRRICYHMGLWVGSVAAV